MFYLNWSSVLLVFRLVSLLEGVSYLLILSVTLGLIGREFVYALGMAHGVLFIAYMMMSLNVSHKQSWPIVVWLLIFFASVVPFAFILVELYLRNQLDNSESADSALS